MMFPPVIPHSRSMSGGAITTRDTTLPALSNQLNTLASQMTTISTEVRCDPDARSWNSSALYLSSGVTNWNFSKDTFPAPAPFVALPITCEFVAPSEKDERSNDFVFVAWFWIVDSPTGVSLPKSFVGASNIVMSTLEPDET